MRVNLRKCGFENRYSATFSSNCFAINKNQVAEMVAAAILVATAGYLKDGCGIHAVDFCSAFSLSCFQRVARADAGWIRHRSRMDTISPCLYPASLVLLRICRQGRPLLAPSRIFTARVSTRHRSSRSFDCAQDFACGLRRPQRKKRSRFFTFALSRSPWTKVQG